MKGMKKKVVFLLAFFILLLTGSALGAGLPEFGEEEGVIISETKSGDILFEQNQGKKYFPASTTKLLTALVAVEEGSLGDKITVGDEITLIDDSSSVAGLVKNEVLTLNELLYALLLPSGNDAANTIAVNVGKKIAANNKLDNAAAIAVFVEAMNNKAKILGMNNSNFKNAHGLHDEEHYTTPEDLLKLGKAAFDNDVIREISRTKEHKLKVQIAPKVSGDKTTTETSDSSTTGSVITEHVWHNSNMLLFPSYELLGENYVQETGLTGENPVYNAYATSGKTGFEDAAQKCLVFEAESGDKDIIGVILKGGEEGIFEEANDTINALIKDYSFVSWTKENNYFQDVVVENFHIFDGKTIGLKTENPFITLVPNDKKETYTTKIKWDEKYLKEVDKKMMLQSDVNENTVVGNAEIYDGSTLIESEPVLAINGVGVRTWRDYPIIYWYITILVILIILALLRILYVYIKRKNKIKYRKRRPSGQPTRTGKTNRQRPTGSSGGTRRRPPENSGSRNQKTSSTNRTSNSNRNRKK